MTARKALVDATVLQALPDTLVWTARPQPDDLAALPSCPAVYLFLAESQQPVQLATTQHLRRLAKARLVGPGESLGGRADLAEIVRAVRWREVHSAFEGRWWYYRLARQMYHREYRTLVSFGPAYFLHVDWDQPIPEIQVSERIWQEPGRHVGPWLTRATCQKALDGLWDLFDLCRYPEQVRRAPNGQRCAYAQMGRCDAPCDGSVPLAPYIERCRAAWRFAGGGVQDWIDTAKRRMKLAAEQQRFEAAGQIKGQLTFAWHWQEKWSTLVRSANDLNYLLAVPVTRRRAWKLFLFRQGWLADGPIFSDRKLPGQGGAWLRERLSEELEPIEPLVRTEQTWLISHFLKSREGDVSLIKPLPAGDWWAGAEDDLRQWVAQRRAVRSETAAGSPAQAGGSEKPSAPAEPAKNAAANDDSI
jgi:excinuclease UvrABC nuclease subunit